MLSIIAKILPFALKLIGYFIEKKINDKNTKEKNRLEYLNFLQSIESSLGDAAMLRKSAQDQMSQLNGEINEMDKKSD